MKITYEGTKITKTMKLSEIPIVVGGKFRVIQEKLSIG